MTVAIENPIEGMERPAVDRIWKLAGGDFRSSHRIAGQL